MRDAAVSLRKWGPYMGLAACTAVAIAMRGYSFGVSDQTFYLAFLEKWSHPELFPTDFVFARASGRDSLIWTLLWHASRVFPIRGLFALLYGALSYGSLLLAYKTALLLWKKERAAWLAVVLWIPAYAVPGSAMSTMEFYLHGRAFGMLCGMTALYAFLAGRCGTTGIALWMGGVLRLVSVVHLAAGMALAALLGRRWKCVASIGCAMGAAGLSLVLLWHHYGVVQDRSGIYSGDWYEMVTATMPELFPQAWDGTTWLHLAIYGAASLGLGAWAFRRAKPGEAGREFPVLLAGLCGVAGLGFALIAVFHLKAVTLLAPFHGTLYLVYGAALVLAGILVEQIESGGPAVGAMSAFVAGAWCTGRLGAQVAALLVLVFLFKREILKGFALRCIRYVQPPRTVLFILLGCVGAGAASYYLGIAPSDLSRWRGFPESELWFAATFACLVVFVGGILRAARWPGRVLADAPLWPIPFALTLLLFLPAPMVDSLVSRPGLKDMALSPAARKLYGPSILRRVHEAEERARPLDEERAMEDALPGLVPLDATVIVPPGWEGFRLRTGRSSFVTIKDRSVALFYRDFYAEWGARMRAIRSLDAGYACRYDLPPLSEAELKGLAARYASLRLRYVVSRYSYDLPALLRRGPYTLYAIAPPPP